MAERRMFAKTIVDSDAFLDMSLSTQALYFHLAMRADDDGFINNPKKIARMIGSNDDEFKILIAKKFILTFESGVIVIKHWKIHNYIQKDRYKKTNYHEEMALLETKENNVYTLDTECIQDVRLGKVRIELGKDSKEDKVKSLQITNNGMDYSEINALMNNLEQVEVVSNKVVSISKGSTNNRTIDFNKEILAIPTNELNEKHFSLSKPSLFRDAPSEYLETLERYINSCVDKLEIEININGGNLSKVLKWDDFYLGAYNYEKKYVNFAMTYQAWARRSK